MPFPLGGTPFSSPSRWNSDCHVSAPGPHVLSYPFHWTIKKKTGKEFLSLTSKIIERLPGETLKTFLADHSSK
jgi:hypothetical protein